VTAEPFEVERPPLKAGGSGDLLSVTEDRPSAVDQEHAEIGIAALADGSEASAQTARVLTGRVAAARVLFLCTGNSARSQMAEALVRARSRGASEAYSAGSHPKPVHPNAVRVMREEHGLDLTGHASKHLDVFDAQRFDWVISLCDRVREVCPEFPGHPETIHWSIPNPAAGDADDDATYPLFKQTAAELATRIGFLLAVLTDRAPKEKP
jgi:protein-tyrosine-phosphatase